MTSETWVRASPRLAGLFDRPVVAYELPGPAQLEPLDRREAVCVPNAKEKRLREFSSGRACARAALRELGFPDFPLLVGTKREPLWPDSCVGSITHADGFCGAVATPATSYAGIGIDVERLNRLKSEVERLICTPGELLWLDSLPRPERSSAATILFSGKEAFYKCQYPLTKSWLGFRDVVWSPVENGFEIRLVAPDALAQLRQPVYRGNYFLDGGHVYSGIAICPD